MTTLRRTTSEMSLDAKILYERLCQVPVGEMISYEELKDCIHRDCQREANGCLQTARKKAERDNGIVFECLRNEGMKRLGNEEIPAIGIRAISHNSRMARRALRKLNHVDLQTLSPEASVTFHTSASILGVMALSGSAQSVKKIENKAKELVATLPTAETLRLLQL